MYAMRIQQELVAKGFELPRPRSPRVRVPAESDEAGRFIARSLAWEQRLAQLRAQAATRATTVGDEGVPATEAPANRASSPGRPTRASRPTAPSLT